MNKKKFMSCLISTALIMGSVSQMVIPVLAEENSSKIASAAEAASVPEVQMDIPSLKDVYKDYFKLGTAIIPSDLDEEGKAIVKKHFNSITCGNEMKPENVLDYEATIAYMEKNKGDQTHPQINFKKADETLSFADQNNIPMRGHVFVWHSQTPNWFFKENYSKDKDAPNVSKEVMEQRLENYIKSVFAILKEQYPNVKFYAWDVVNEAVNPSTPDGLRAAAAVATTSGDDGNNENANNSMWMTTMGKDSIIKAFEFARKYAPEGTLLTYNDYNECDPVKRDIIYDLCKELKEKGLIDVIGMQGHYNMSSPSIEQFEEAIRKYSKLGVKIQVTELDIMLEDQSEEGYLKQGYRFKSFMDVLKRLDQEEGIDIDACILWGIKDSNSWRKEKTPLIFDKDYQAKPAYWGMADPTKLELLTKEFKVPMKQQGSDSVWLSQKGQVIMSAEGKEVADLKLAWDDKNLYVKVTATPAYSKEQGKLNLWVDPQYSKEAAAGKSLIREVEFKGEQVLVIPMTEALKEKAELGFEISAAFDGVRATWNNTNYDGKSESKRHGKLVLSKAIAFTSAVKGTPVIDGKIDEIWKNAPSISIDQFSQGKDGATATAKTMWDQDNLYVLVEVKDSLLSKKSQDAYQQDSVEVFIDEDNAKTMSYSEGDVQYRVNFENERSINGYSDADSFITATSKTADGYLVELALPHRLAPFGENQVLGFDIQINNDQNGDGKRDTTANWNDMTGNGWSSTEAYGTIQLKHK